jgi:hypothetical protein
MKHILILAPAVLALACAALAPEEAREPSAAVLKALEEIGTWDGKTESAELAGPYEDPLQQEIPFGQRSYYLVPWRAYMDTWPARTFLDCLGVNFNVSADEADATAAVLAEAGIRSARVEVGMGSFRYEDPAQPSDPKGIRRRLEALKKHGIRPLLLLNANSGWPCPIKSLDANLTKGAAEGAREIYLDKTDSVQPHYTGLRGMAYQVAFPLITAADKATGRCELSAPLPKPLKAGHVVLHTLKYPPLAFEAFADGRPNAAAKETLGGWMTYVAALAKLAKEALGTEGAADAGFDLEVWNELTFGSQYLDDKNYYSPPRDFRKPRFTYKGKGFGYEVLLAMTVDYANDPASRLPGVAVIDGFSNQRPWENGAGLWPGQAGFSRHYYTGLNAYHNFDGNTGLVSPETDSSRRHQVLNALGKPEAKMERDRAVLGTFFIPTLRIAMPESLFYGYKTELMGRDLQPWPNSMKGHGRYSHPGTGRHAQVWQTEFNLDRQPWAEWLLKQPGVRKDDPRLLSLMHHVGAKALLRTYFFQSHKGVHTVEVFAAREPDTSLGVMPMAFFDALKKANFQLTDGVRALRGPPLEALGRAATVMKTGKPIVEARPLAVTKLVEEQPRLVFRGDGTPEHPDRFNRDDFACLPYQLDGDRFAVAYYVVTRNMGHVWAKDRDLLEPARYDMPDQRFRLTLTNVRGEGAKVSVYDPMTDRTAPAEAVGRGGTTLTVCLPTSDYPRLLVIEESQPGPLVLSPRLTVAADGSAEVSFSTNVKKASYAAVSWGPLPDRQSGGSEQVRGDTAFTCKIPKLEVGQGVRIMIESDGLRAYWPRWGHDTAGVRW